MAVFMSVQECRKKKWHVVTYDISNPKKWVEVDDIATEQPCENDLRIVNVSRCGSPQTGGANAEFSFPYEVQKSPVTIPFSAGKFTWELPVGDQPVMAGAISVMKGSKQIQSGSASLIRSKGQFTFAYALKQDQNTLTQTVTVDCGNNSTRPEGVHVETKAGELIHEATFRISHQGVTMVDQSNDDPKQFSEMFDLEHFHEIAKTIEGADGIMELEFQASAGWSTFDQIAITASLTLLLALCIDGVIPACVSAIAVATNVKRCMETPLA